MADNTVNISAQNDTVTVETDALANKVSVTNSDTTVNVTAPNDTVTIDKATGANTVTINSQSDITKLLSITEQNDTVTVTEPAQSKIVTVTTPGPPGPPIASVTETDSAVTFNRDIKLNAGEHINLVEDQRIYFEADLETWIESHVSDAFRVVAGGNQMMIWDYDTGNRAVFGNGTKVYIGANNNALPSKELEVDGDMLIGDYIKHMGDEDTYIRFQANNLNLVSGGNSFIKCDKSTNKIQLNNGNADLDVQIMGDDGSQILHTDAGTNRVGILETSPSYTLDVDGDIRVTGGLVVDSNYNNSSIHATNILLTNAVKYTDSGGDARYAIQFDSDVVALSNRTSNGVVQIRANTSTAGSGGETTVAQFEDDSIEFNTNTTVKGNLDIADTIYHTGDSNTKIRFPEVDTISFHTSGNERLRISPAGHITGSGNLKIDGSVVDFSNLPTSDPGVAGRLWNDSNTLKISAG